MIIYILMLLLALLFSFIATKTKNKKLRIVLPIFSAIPFAVVSAIRYDVGTDYLYRYASNFNVLLKGRDVSNLEIGFKILNKLCILITNNYQIIFVLTSFIITSFIFYTIYRDSKNVPLSITLYFIGAFFFQSLNMVRQFVAISIILYSYKYFLNKDWIKWLLFTILASMFHTTSLVVAILCLGNNFVKKIFQKDIFENEKVVFGLIIFAFLAEPLIGNIINFLLEQTRFGVYVGSKYDHGDLQIISFIINLLLYIGMIYIQKKRKHNGNEVDCFFITMQAIALLFVTLGKTSFLSIRLVYYFSIFQIISIPYFLKYVKEIWNEKIYKVSMLIVIIFVSTTLIWTHVVNNTDEVLPYKTIFNKSYEFK